MTQTLKRRGLLVCAAIVLFLVGRNFDARLDEAASSASSAETSAEEAKATAEEAGDSASAAQDAADEANEKADRLCNYSC